MCGACANNNKNSYCSSVTFMIQKQWEVFVTLSKFNSQPDGASTRRNIRALFGNNKHFSVSGGEMTAFSLIV